MKDWFDERSVARRTRARSGTPSCAASPWPSPGFDFHVSKPTAATGENATKEATVGVKRSVEDGQELINSCLEYARKPAEGVQDVLTFLQHFNLDLRRMKDDPSEDPLQRMMQLSLDYGIDAPVSFSLNYDVTAEGPAPFSLVITLNPEVREFVSARHSLEEDEVDDFYQYLLAHYALVDDENVTAQLADTDDEVSLCEMNSREFPFELIVGTNYS
ncbi:hypothetical protein HPB51_029824 [Rhipicephalus microplus]|uniref:Uncharacterized protein n=1 Tax=Rhipicephalus microplus TaxID=6941 RepID=A0A9J6CSB0_RHIMP|nr:hypothetical protein HPB51_029824 [Rhipicephalus microplus]